MATRNYVKDTTGACLVFNAWEGSGAVGLFDPHQPPEVCGCAPGFQGRLLPWLELPH
jgi:hypothetical protein